MNDMSSVIIPRSDQTNADSLLAGPRTITITKIEIKPGAEQPVAISYTGDDGKPYKPCKSMARVLVHLWGPDSAQYVGKSMTLYCDPKVKWGGMAVGGIRISHMSHITAPVTMALTETKGNKKPFTVQPLVIAPTVDKVAEGADAMIARVNESDADALAAMVTDETVIKQRAWMADKRPELAAKVADAIAAQMASLAAASPAAAALAKKDTTTESDPN